MTARGPNPKCSHVGSDGRRQGKKTCRKLRPKTEPDRTLPSAVNFAVLHNTVANDRHTSPTLRSSHLEVLGIRTGSEVI